MRFLILVLIFNPTFSLAKTDTNSCQKWFAKIGVKPSDSGCLVRCASAETDFASLNCNDLCEEFCQNTCSEASEFWKGKFKDGAPIGWPHKSEVKKVWSENKSQEVLRALSTIPNALWQNSIKEIYLMEKSKDFPNPASHSKGIIVLYDTAFSSKLLSRILVHELAHEVFDNLSNKQRDDYKSVTNWFEDGKNRVRRSTGFVKEDGKLSVEEDFANNLEFYLFQPQRLKSVTPHAYNWINRHFGDKFNLRRPCDSSNKN